MDCVIRSIVWSEVKKNILLLSEGDEDIFNNHTFFQDIFINQLPFIYDVPTYMRERGSYYVTERDVVKKEGNRLGRNIFKIEIIFKCSICNDLLVNELQ